MAEARPSGEPSPLAFVGVTLLAFILFVGVMYLKYRVAMISAVLAVRHFELQIVGIFTSRYADLDASVLGPDWSRIGIVSLLRLGTIVGGIYSVPGAVLLGGLAMQVFFCAPGQRFRVKIRTLDDLVLVQSDRFRFARAFVARKRELRNPAWGQRPRPGDLSLHPAEWIAAYARDSRGAYHDDLSRAAFAQQLGPVWSGVHAAAPHVRCLFAAFALHADRQRADAGSFLGDLATALPPGNGDTPLALADWVIKIADRILQDVEMIRPCVQIAARHAYTATAIMGVLQHARDRAGVLNPGLFNWLKLVDRALWYPLVMPPNPYAEGAGAYAHFVAEGMAEVPLFTPHIEPALASVRAQTHQTAAAAQRRF
jgi:intracellular multiplication protein IcmP